ncbi:MAG: cadmium carbonic anhydrase [Proteobacteria bacterium]|nr:cadmium carbonic anhydrase [Pseudomonadota bacterium]
MKIGIFVTAAMLAVSPLLGGLAQAQEYCQKFGPQTPRDISSKAGTNARAFPFAAAPKTMNLCNIHYHVNAEHKGPGFAVFAGKGEHGGWKCNQTPKLTQAELKAPDGGACKGLKPGDTIEVHWVYSSCDVAPGSGLGACLSPQCGNPTLRVETQVFLVVNSKAARNFADFDYTGAPIRGLHQPKSLPARTGTPVVFRGSTTGPSYTEQKCSPLQVTWSVRPACAKIDINSVHKWCEKNAFQEDHGHGVRDLVTAPALLDKIR